MKATLFLSRGNVFSVVFLIAPAVVLAVDTDGDGVDDTLDLCCNTPAGASVDAQGRPRADLDLDCDVDLADVTAFKTTCGGRSAVPFPSGCSKADFDSDGDADLNDFGFLQRSITGSLTCPASGCSCPCPTGLANCNGVFADGCEVNLNNNPGCGTSINLGTINGDLNADVATFDGNGERWFHVTISDALSQSNDIAVRIRLTPSAGTNYDLYVYCYFCGGTTFFASRNTGSTIETLNYTHADPVQSDDTRNLVIEVRYVSGEGCGDYHLEVKGNTGIDVGFTCP